MQHHGAGVMLGGLDPEAKAERVPAPEHARPQELERVVAVEAEAAGAAALAPQGGALDLAALAALDAVRDRGAVAVVHGIEPLQARRRGRIQGCRASGELLAPGLEGVLVEGQRLEGGLRLGQLGGQGLEARSLLVGREVHGGRGDRGAEVRIEPALVDVVEEGAEPVVLALGEGVVLVVVAAGTLHRQPEDRRAEGVDPVGHILHPELLLHAAALIGLAVQPVERGGEDLVGRGVGKEVPGELLQEEGVVGLVLLEGA